MKTTHCVHQQVARLSSGSIKREVRIDIDHIETKGTRRASAIPLSLPKAPSSSDSVTSLSSQFNRKKSIASVSSVQSADDLLKKKRRQSLPDKQIARRKSTQPIPVVPRYITKYISNDSNVCVIKCSSQTFHKGKEKLYRGKKWGIIYHLWAILVFYQANYIPVGIPCKKKSFGFRVKCERIAQSKF